MERSAHEMCDCYLFCLCHRATLYYWGISRIATKKMNDSHGVCCTRFSKFKKFRK